MNKFIFLMLVLLPCFTKASCDSQLDFVDKVIKLNKTSANLSQFTVYRQGEVISKGKVFHRDLLYNSFILQYESDIGAKGYFLFSTDTSSEKMYFYSVSEGGKISKVVHEGILEVGKCSLVFREKNQEIKVDFEDGIKFRFLLNRGDKTIEMVRYEMK